MFLLCPDLANITSPTQRCDVNYRAEDTTCALQRALDHLADLRFEVVWLSCVQNWHDDAWSISEFWHGHVIVWQSPTPSPTPSLISFSAPENPLLACSSALCWGGRRAEAKEHLGGAELRSHWLHLEHQRFPAEGWDAWPKAVDPTKHFFLNRHAWSEAFFGQKTGDGTEKVNVLSP